MDELNDLNEIEEIGTVSEDTHGGTHGFTWDAAGWKLP